MKYIEALAKLYDRDIYSGDLLSVRPREDFRHVTEDLMETENPRDLLSEYYHWFSYYNYLTNKFQFISGRLEQDYKDILKTSVLDESLGSSEKKREANVLNDSDVQDLQRQTHIAAAKYKDSRAMLQVAEYSYALVSRSFTIKSTDIELNKPL